MRCNVLHIEYFSVFSILKNNTKIQMRGRKVDHKWFKVNVSRGFLEMDIFLQNLEFLRILSYWRYPEISQIQIS